MLPMIQPHDRRHRQRGAELRGNLRCRNSCEEACGDAKPHSAGDLDPQLTISQPHAITATAGFDAITHAVETYVTPYETRSPSFFA